MSNFYPDQGRTRVFGEAYSLYAAAGNPRRTQIRAKRAIYGWKIFNPLNLHLNRRPKRCYAGKRVEILPPLSLHGGSVGNTR